jgi:hypothetical protein
MGGLIMNKKDIIDKLLESFIDKEEYSKPIYHTVNDKKYTLADLMIRQFLNNGCDGFDMVNVGENYGWLLSIKDDLIKYNLISKNAKNNSGFPLWNNYDF